MRTVCPPARMTPAHVRDVPVAASVQRGDHANVASRRRPRRRPPSPPQCRRRGLFTAQLRPSQLNAANNRSGRLLEADAAEPLAARAQRGCDGNLTGECGGRTVMRERLEPDLCSSGTNAWIEHLDISAHHISLASRKADLEGQRATAALQRRRAESERRWGRSNTAATAAATATTAAPQPHRRRAPAV